MSIQLAPIGASIPQSSKFSMLLLEGANFLNERHSLGRFGYVEPNWFEFASDSLLQRCVGELQMDRLQRNGFAIVAFQESEKPDTVDDENELLSSQLKRLLTTMTVLRIHLSGEPILLSGTMINGQAEVRTYRNLAPLLPIPIHANIPMCSDVCTRILEVHEILSLMLVPDKFKRFARGLQALIHLGSESSGAERMLHMIRALDAIAFLQKGEGQQHFAKRLSQFVCPERDAVAMLKDWYSYRNDIVHMNEPAIICQPGESLDLAIARRNSEFYFLQIATFDIYEKIIVSEKLRKNFESDNAIQSFWSMPSNMREIMTGEPASAKAIELRSQKAWESARSERAIFKH